MELGDGKFPAPFAPPPAEPFRFFFVCESGEEWVRQFAREDWRRWVPNSEFVEDWERWNECKGMVFFSGPGAATVSHSTAHFMRKFFARDKGEALVYQLDSITHTFIGRDEKWLDYPGRFYE